MSHGSMTIDELSRATGMTARNIRAHQSRGLLPPPEIRARTGYYGPHHVERLRLISELQAEGFNLAAIKRMVSSPDAAGFTRAVLTPFGDEEAETVTRAELERRFGGAFDPAAIRRAERLGILVPTGEDAWEVPSPTLLRAGEQLIAEGIPMRHALAVADRIDRHTRAIAEAFVRLFVQDVVAPRKADWEAMVAALERLRPLAGDAVLAAFQQRMTRAVEESVGR